MRRPSIRTCVILETTTARSLTRRTCLRTLDAYTQLPRPVQVDRGVLSKLVRSWREQSPHPTLSWSFVYQHAQELAKGCLFVKQISVRMYEVAEKGVNLTLHPNRGLNPKNKCRRKTF